MAGSAPSAPGYDFELDDFQVRATRALDEGRSVLVAVITPSGDPISMLMLSVPMVVFYELSVLIGRIIERRRVAAAAAP